jgi:hypothetical protein
MCMLPRFIVATGHPSSGATPARGLGFLIGM